MLTNAQVIVQDAGITRRNKLVYISLTAFILLTLFIKLCPILTLWDKALIVFIQEGLKNVPLWIAELPDCKLYSIMIALPLIIGSILFFKRKELGNGSRYNSYKAIVLFCSIPLVTFLLNCIIKPLVHRVRPPYEMQLSVHPDSFSYVSSHSLVTICLWGMVIYFINKYCKNRALKIAGILFSILWILFVGVSRIWLGVHHPTDVIGAYVLGLVLISCYIKLFTKAVRDE